MKKCVLLSLGTLFLTAATAQQVSWMHAVPATYALNPGLPQQMIFSGGVLAGARLDSSVMIYGQDVYGVHYVERYDTSGTLLWSFPLSDKSSIDRLVADAAGNVYVAGKFMETLRLGAGDSLVNTGTATNVNLFLMSLDANGTLRWKRNVSLTHSAAMLIGDLDLDPAGHCWYALVEFSFTSIIRLDTAGQDAQSHLISGTRMVGSFSFDGAGNLFVAGSTQSGTLTVAGTAVTVPESYMMFLTRITTGGACSWIHLAHDVTFQAPMVVASPSGDAWIGCNLLDSTTFGSVSFHGPQWVYDLFVARVDSSGNFLWGAEPAVTPSITGDAYAGKMNFMDIDALGNLYLLTFVRGDVDWGHGIHSHAGTVSSDGLSVVRFDGSGTAQWQMTGTSGGILTPYSLSLSPTGECYFACASTAPLTLGGVTVNGMSGFAFITGKLSGPVVTGVSGPVREDVFSVYPVPAAGTLHFSQPVSGTLELFDPAGRRVTAGKVRQATSWQPGPQSAGTYFLVWTGPDGKREAVKPVVLY